MTQALTLPKNIPNIAKAKLPPSYEAAKMALAKCEHLDEVKDWADKMAALASYARQAEDEALEKMCMRIRGRAVRRVGEMLKQVKREEHAGRPKTKGLNNGSPGGPIISAAGAAREAGISPKAAKTAMRVANVPEEKFEEEIESDDPPTVKELAEMAPSPPKPIIDLRGRDPKEFKISTNVQGAIVDLAETLEDADPEVVVRGAYQRERVAMKQQFAKIEKWFARASALMKDYRNE